MAGLHSSPPSSPASAFKGSLVKGIPAQRWAKGRSCPTWWDGPAGWRHAACYRPLSSLSFFYNVLESVPPTQHTPSFSIHPSCQVMSFWNLPLL